MFLLVHLVEGKGMGVEGEGVGVEGMGMSTVDEDKTWNYIPDS
jgi:hypothetical protein